MGWCGKSNRRIVCPDFFSETTVSGETYRNVLSTYATPWIRALQRRSIFTHNGAPPHVYGLVKEFLLLKLRKRLDRKRWNSCSASIL